MVEASFGDDVGGDCSGTYSAGHEISDLSSNVLNAANCSLQ